MNRGHFYNTVRDVLFDGSLSQDQVDGMERILDEAARRGTVPAQTGYMLGTVYWETGRAMQPVEERGGDDYFFRMYDIHGERPHVARQLGNTQPGDGVRFHGRSLVQITGRRNYRIFGEMYDVPLEDDPDLALDPDISTGILFDGMLRGIFTGRKLGEFVTDEEFDFRNARRVVNGLDKADLIASHARVFELGIRRAEGAGSIHIRDTNTEHNDDPKRDAALNDAWRFMFGGEA